MKYTQKQPSAPWYPWIKKFFGVICDNIHAAFTFIFGDILSAIVNAIGHISTSVYGRITIQLFSYATITLPIGVAIWTIWEFAMIAIRFLAAQSGVWQAALIGVITAVFLNAFEVLPLFGTLFEKCADLQAELKAKSKAIAMDKIAVTCKNFLGGQYLTIEKFRWWSIGIQLLIALADQFVQGKFMVTKMSARGIPYQVWEPSIAYLWPLVYVGAVGFALELTLIVCASANGVLSAAVDRYHE